MGRTMSQINYVQLHIGDIIKDTYHLSDEEMGAYIRLVLAYYDKFNTGIPAKKISQIIESEFTETIQEFFVLKNDIYRHKRCDKEIKKILDKSKTARKSVEKRWKKQKVKSDTNEIQTYNECNTNQEPLTNNQEPLTNTKEEELPKVNTKKDLQDTTLDDLSPWLAKKISESIVIKINIPMELEKCKAHFASKKRTIATAYKWLLQAQQWYDEKNPQASTEEKPDVMADILGGKY